MNTMIEESKSPLTEAEIAKAELELGVSFPADYRAFMARFNGGRPEPDGFRIEWRADQAGGEGWRTSAMGWLYAIWGQRVSNLVRSNKLTFAGRLPKGTLTIATDAGGNQILLALSGPQAGKVLFWVKDNEVEEGEEPGYDNVGFVANSFADFITNRLY